jgi:hypothetical protein
MGCEKRQQTNLGRVFTLLAFKSEIIHYDLATDKTRDRAPNYFYIVPDISQVGINVKSSE